MTTIRNPNQVAQAFRAEIREAVQQLPEPLRIRGILATDARPSHVYADYTEAGCDDVGIQFQRVVTTPAQLAETIRAANDDNSIHGVLVYYPILGAEADREIREVVDPHKDIEGLTSFWVDRLYDNIRHVDDEGQKKAVLPCTPLAIVKLIEQTEWYRPDQALPLAGRRAAVFNRSEVVGRPLASMLSNDGAEVYSFDEFGIQVVEGQHFRDTTQTRASILAQADIVITGVPSKRFDLVHGAELKPGCLCINFSTLRNFDKDIVGKAGVLFRRVGPMTVAMVLRNTLRLYQNFKQDQA